VIPRKIRMIAEVTIISAFVIVFDQYLKAYNWEMSRQLGPYVGLIITNCIVMGRAEAFALQNPPVLSMLDGAANGLGYTAFLAAVAIVREILGKGELLGFTLLPVEFYTRNQLMILARGAFFTLGFLIAFSNLFKKPVQEEAKK
jgi:Na+-transporting NADH:ubiquinone oxidoreductase subunit D